MPVFYFTRALWLPYAPPIPYLTAPGPVPDSVYNLLQRPIWQTTRYQPVPNFRDDAEAGLSSASFNLADNIEAGDSRAGLDDRGKDAVRRIMREQKVDFDEARRLYIEQRFGKENIGPDGRPRDPKAVMFDRLR